MVRNDKTEMCDKISSMKGTGLSHVLWLGVGDVVVFILVTIFGFASHGEVADAGLRMLTTFLPLLIAWWVVGFPGGVYDLTLLTQPRQLWRPFWAMLVAGPLAILLRSLMLGNRPMIPVFALVLTGISAVSILAWRIIFYLIFMRKT